MVRSIRYSRLMLPLVLTLCVVLVFPPAAFGFFGSLTVEKEKELGEEFCLQLQQYYPVVRDPYLTAYINAIGQKLVKQLGPQPFQFRFFILEDPTYNAFAVPGGYIFVNTGIIQLMDREDELAGVLAHEITHVHQRHMAKRMEKAKIQHHCHRYRRPGRRAAGRGGSRSPPYWRHGRRRIRHVGIQPGR